jgi:hypothetical protein
LGGAGPAYFLFFFNQFIPKHKSHKKHDRDG